MQAVLVTFGTDTGQADRQAFADRLQADMDEIGLSRRGLRDLLADQGYPVTEQAIGTWLRAEFTPQFRGLNAIERALAVARQRRDTAEAAS